MENWELYWKNKGETNLIEKNAEIKLAFIIGNEEYQFLDHIEDVDR